MGWLFKDQISYFDLMQFENYADFTEGVVRGKRGELMIAWQYTGIDDESASDEELNYTSMRLNSMLRNLDSGWSMWAEAIRVETHDYPSAESCHFPDPISRLIDDQRRKTVREQEDHYETVAFIVLMYTPDTKLNRSVIDAMVTDDGISNLTMDEKLMRYFNRAISEFDQSLSLLFDSRRLKPWQAADGYWYCPFLQLLHYCATGIQRMVRVPHPACRFDALIAGQDFFPSFTPRVGELYVGAVSIEGTQTFTEPAMLAAFDQLPLRYRWSTRFIAMDRNVARAKLGSARRKWHQKRVAFKDQLFQNPNPTIDLDADRMVVDADEALAEVSSGEVNEGYYNSAFIVYAENYDVMVEGTQRFKSLLDNLGFGGRIESINAVETFLGSIPGNTYTNIARTPINTSNLADLMPVATAWPGDEFHPCPFYPPHSPPLIQGETPGSTPFRLNLHVDDVGHCLIIGPTGSGKSTLLAMIAVSQLKYPQAQVFCFDKGLSLYTLTKAVGGVHYEMGSEHVMQTQQLAPLAHIDTSSDFAWACEWVEQCLQLQNITTDVMMRREVQNAMQRLKESPSRSITEFVANLQNVVLREAMAQYTLEGPSGELLDGEQDSVSFNQFSTIEISELMQMGDRIALPVLLYLFRKIERMLQGQPSLIILDECWLMLDHAVFREKIREWLKVLRKANCAVVMATQSVEDAAVSGIMGVINESCASKILLPNREIHDESINAFYKNNMALNDNEISLLNEAVPKKQYYYRSSRGRRIFELNLKPRTLAFVGISSPNDIARIRALSGSNPEDWQYRWLSEYTGEDHSAYYQPIPDEPTETIVDTEVAAV